MSFISSFVFLCFIFQSCCSPDKEQSRHLIPGKVLPFELKRDVVLVPVTIADKTFRSVILDTGMPFEGVLLFHREYTDSINIPAPVRVTIPGAGGGEPSTGLMLDSAVFYIGSARFVNQRIIILESDYSQHFPTDGIIGQTLLRYPVVGLDFGRKELILADTLMLPDDNWSAVDISLNERRLPFLTIHIGMKPGDSLIPLVVYLDLAADEPLELLIKPGSRFSMPDNTERKYLGTGLSGDIYGMEGIVDKIVLGGQTVQSMRTAFPDPESRSKQGGKAEGIIGCGLLKHFNVIFDFCNNIMYLQKL